MGAWPRNSVADASFELYCELDRTGTSTTPRHSANGTASSTRVPASLPPPQNATGTADGEAMAVYKAKVSNIMSEMMARMRRDAQERDEIADTANEWRRKHDSYSGGTRRRGDGLCASWMRSGTRSSVRKQQRRARPKCARTLRSAKLLLQPNVKYCVRSAGTISAAQGPAEAVAAWRCCIGATAAAA